MKGKQDAAQVSVHGWYCFAYWDRFYPGQSVRRIRIQRPVSVCTAWGLWTAPASPGLPTYVQGAYFVYTIWYTITAHATGSWGRRCALMIAHDQHSSSPLPMGLPGLSIRKRCRVSTCMLQMPTCMLRSQHALLQKSHVNMSGRVLHDVATPTCMLQNFNMAFQNSEHGVSKLRTCMLQI